MDFDRLVIEQAAGGAVRLVRPDGFGGDYSDFSLEIRKGFAIATILEAVAATGWVVERGGEYRIEQAIGCDRLARLVDRMSWYFDGPNTPGRELLRIKGHVEADFLDRGEPLEVPLWACAWLDAILREDAADEASSVDQLWRKQEYTINVARLCAARMRELRKRYSQVQSRSQSARIAGSARTRTGDRVRGKSAG